MTCSSRAPQTSIIDLLNARGKNSELSLVGKPAVIFIVGVNGAGKTTTIDKLASKFGNEGAKVGEGARLRVACRQGGERGMMSGVRVRFSDWGQG